MNDKVIVKAVDNGARAMEEIDVLYRLGYSPEDIYVLAHDRDHTDFLADAADVNTIGMEEEGLMRSMAGLFRSRGDDLRVKLQSMGCAPSEAKMYEAELDRGKVIVMARIRTTNRI